MGFRSGSGSGQFRLKLDFASVGLLILSGAIFIFSGINPDSASIGTFLVAFLGLGLGLMFIVNWKRIDIEGAITSKESKQEVYGFLGSLVVLLGSSAFVSTFPTNLGKIFGLSIEQGGISNSIITMLIPAPEEVFFRATLTPYLARSFNDPRYQKVFGSGAGGTLFMVYHFFVYGDSSSSLLFVWLAGVTLSYVILVTGRLTITLGAHMVNNFLSLGFPTASAYVPSVQPNGIAVKALEWFVLYGAQHLASFLH